MIRVSKTGKNGVKTRPKAEERKNFILIIFPFQTVTSWGFCVRKIGKKDRFRLKPQIGEKKIDEKIGKRLRRSTASVLNPEISRIFEKSRESCEAFLKLLG